MDDTEVWLECQLCFRCYYDRWDFRDHCKIYHRRRPKTDPENLIGENVPVPESEGILPSMDMDQNPSNNTGSVKPVIYRSNLEKVKTNTVVVQPDPIDKGSGRPKGSMNRVNNEKSDVKTKLRTKSIKKRSKMISDYFRNKFRITTTLRRLASKVLIENNLTDKLSPENLKMVYFEKTRGRKPIPKKKVEKLNPSPSPRKGRGRPRKIVDYRPYFSSPENSPAKSPIKMEIIPSIPAGKNLDLNLEVDTRPKFSYQDMLKGCENSQNLENVQSSLKSPSENVPSKIASKIHAEIFPQIVYESVVKKYSSNEQGGSIEAVRKDTNVTKNQDTDASPQIMNNRGRPRKQPGFYKVLIEGGAAYESKPIIPIINPTTDNTKEDMTRKGQDRDDPSKTKTKRIRRSDELDLLKRARKFDWKNYGKKSKSESGQDCYKCRTCNKKILSIYNFFYHNLMHAGEKPLKCQFCDMGFNRGEDRHKHEEKHNKDQMEFKRSQNLERSKLPDGELALPIIPIINPTDKDKEIQNKSSGNNDASEIEKMIQNYSELTFGKVVDILDSPVGTSSSSANSVNITPAKDAFPTPDVQISVVELKK